jgi:hypothetical protein
VAQSWAATWHPIIGLLVVYQNFGFGVVGGRTGDLPGEQRLNQRGLATRAKGGACYGGGIKMF